LKLTALPRRSIFASAIAALFCLLAAAMAPVHAAGEETATTYTVSTTGLRGGDEVSAVARKKRLYIEVRHKNGIGEAVIKLKEAQWPDTAQVRFFDFNSLEGFTASGGTKIDLLEPGSGPKRRTFTVELLPLNVEAHGLKLNWVDAYRH